MKEAQLPPEWAILEGTVSYVQRVSDKEYCCSCPTCGGQPHASGEWPDRCRLFLGERPRLWCRRCGLVAFPDQFGDSRFQRPSAEELKRFREQREAEAQAKLRSAQRELQLLRDTHLWESYHDALGQAGRQWWRGRGIPDDYQNFWGFGWCSERNAASIPLFGYGWTFENIKYRLCDESKGKYRYHVSGLSAPLFLCDPDRAIEGHVIAVEGELKSAVLAITLDDPRACIVGIPGLNPSPHITATLAQAERVTLILDPGSDRVGHDGWSPMGRIVQAIGRSNCRVLILPGKIDDILIAMKASKWDVQQILRQAVIL